MDKIPLWRESFSDLFKSTIEREKKSPAPGRIQIYGLLIMSRVLYHNGTSAANVLFVRPDELLGFIDDLIAG